MPVLCRTWLRRRQKPAAGKGDDGANGDCRDEDRDQRGDRDCVAGRARRPGQRDPRQGVRGGCRIGEGKAQDPGENRSLTSLGMRRTYTIANEHGATAPPVSEQIDGTAVQPEVRNACYRGGISIASVGPARPVRGQRIAGVLTGAFSGGRRNALQVVGEELSEGFARGVVAEALAGAVVALAGDGLEPRGGVVPDVGAL